MNFLQFIAFWVCRCSWYVIFICTSCRLLTLFILFFARYRQFNHIIINQNSNNFLVHQHNFNINCKYQLKRLYTTNIQIRGYDKREPHKNNVWRQGWCIWEFCKTRDINTAEIWKLIINLYIYSTEPSVKMILVNSTYVNLISKLLNCHICSITNFQSCCR